MSKYLHSRSERKRLKRLAGKNYKKAIKYSWRAFFENTEEESHSLAALAADFKREAQRCIEQIQAKMN